jgi:hypothetical protein
LGDHNPLPPRTVAAKLHSDMITGAHPSAHQDSQDTHR